jgi:hypothetical protein
MNNQLMRAYVWQQTIRVTARDRLIRDESGEGVISAAIAVLVMAFLGVLMWQLFKGTLTKANSNVNDQLDKIK